MGALIAVGEPDSELRSRSSGGLAVAEGFKVNDAESYEIAATNLSGVKRLLTEIESKRTEITKPINEALRNVNAMFKALAEPVDKAAKIYDQKMYAYREEQRKIADEAQRKRNEEAERQRIELERKAN